MGREVWQDAFVLIGLPASVLGFVALFIWLETRSEMAEQQYRKPLVHGGSRIIDRDSSGRFCTSSLGCKVCASCGQIIPPTYTNLGTEERPLLKGIWPESCPNCGTNLEVLQ